MNTEDYFDETSLCETIIKDAITELQIYGKLHNFPPTVSNHDYDKTLEEKLASPIIYVKNADLIKLQKIRTYLENMLSKLLEGEDCESLLAQHEACKQREDNLLGDVEKLRVKQKRLEHEVEHAGIQQSLLCNEKDEEIGKLKDTYENLLREYKIKEDYIEKWEESRREQLDAELYKNKKVFENTTRDFKNRIEREKRVNSEIEAYNNVVIQDLNDSIVYWQKKYDEDLKSMEEKIAQRKNAKLTQQLKITAITALFQERKKEMDAYRELKELERQRMEEIARINNQATRIQAWWRGVMVRRKLGPYKVKKAKPKGKGKSGKST